MIGDDIISEGEFFECIDCGGSPIEAFGRCASCNTSRRKLERESKKVKIIKPIRKMSESRAKEVPEYSKLKKAFLEDEMICEFNFEGCFKLATQIHHCSLLAKNFLNAETWMRSCPHCHNIVEAMPAELRREKGFLTD